MRRLHGMDALMLYSETPNVHTHTIKVGVLDLAHYDGEFTFEVFRRLLWQRLHLLEPFRYRLVKVPLRLYHPVWMKNSEVDLDYHVHRLSLPAPGGRRELDRVIGEIASTPLDRSRPLWEMYVVEGLADGAIAVVVKIHHVLADGLASGNLLARAMHFTATAEEECEPEPVATPPLAGDLVAMAVREHLRQLVGLPVLVWQTMRGVWRLRAAAKSRDSQPELAGRFSPPPTFINHVLSPGREFASATLSLADIKETSKHLGVKINDLVLATAAGALRELLLRYDGRADRPLVASVPASLDADTTRITGNEVGAMNVSLPVQVDEPLERLRLTSVSTARAKEDFNLLGPSLIASWMGYLPPSVAPFAFRRMSGANGGNRLQNLTISNVPGPRNPGRLGGTMLREFYSVGPLLAGSALNITVWSYVDQLNISILTDDATMADPHELTDAMVHAFVEIRAAAGLPTTLRPVDSAMGAATAIA